MGLFDNLTDTTELEEASDFLGGSSAIPTDVYDCKIKAVYAGKSSSSDARNMTVVVQTEDGKEVSETIYYTNKAGHNFYADKKDSSKRHPLPGFTTINDLCLLVTGHPLAKQETEEKVVKIFDFETKKDIPTPVQCITSLHGKDVKLAIQRETHNKNKKDEGGNYVATEETYTTNAISKVFHAETGRTVNEYKSKAEEPVFMESWKERYAGKDRDRTTYKEGQASGGATGSGRPGQSSQQSESESLFG